MINGGIAATGIVAGVRSHVANVCSISASFKRMRRPAVLRGSLAMVSAALLLLGIPAQARAGDASTPEPHMPAAPVCSVCDTVTVTASRIRIPLRKNPGAITVVGAKDLAAMPRGIAADEALALVPGVRVDNQANGERLHMSIRGQGILSERGLRGIKVLLDGISLNDPTGFASDLYDIDWETVERIEVLRGPAAAIYGCASNAGVINIVTKTGGSRPAGGLAYSAFGSHGFWKELGQVQGSTEKSSYRVSASHTAGDGYRVHQAFWGDIVSCKLDYEPSPNLTITPLFTYSNYFNQNSEGVNDSIAFHFPTEPNSDAIRFNEFIKTTKMTGGAVMRAVIAENQSLALSAYLRAVDFTETNNQAVDYRRILTPGGSLQYSWDARSGGVGSHLTLGSDFSRQTIVETKPRNLPDDSRTEEIGDTSEDLLVDSAILLADQTLTQTGVGVFLLERLEAGARLSLMGNLRYDHISNKLVDMLAHHDSPMTGKSLSGDADFDKVTGRLGVSYALSEPFNPYASWGVGFLPPSTEELINNPRDFGGFNKNLTASRSMGEELGIRGTLGKRARYEVTGFLLNTKNDFFRYRLPAPRNQETFYGNAGDSRRYGAELYASVRPANSLTLQFAYTYSNFKYSSDTSSADAIQQLFLPRKDQVLPNSPEHQLAAQVDYHFLHRFTLGLSANCQTSWHIYTDPGNADITAPGFALFNARLGYDWKVGSLQGALDFSVKNLSDKLWMAFTEPDLDVVESGEGLVLHPNNSYQPGPGREFFLNLRVRL